MNFDKASFYMTALTTENNNLKIQIKEDTERLKKHTTDEEVKIKQLEMKVLAPSV